MNELKNKAGLKVKIPGSKVSFRWYENFIFHSTASTGHIQIMLYNSFTKLKLSDTNIQIFKPEILF